MIIANPASGGGRTGRSWSAVAAALRSAGLDFDVAMTSGPMQATDFARSAVLEGRGMVVAAGGDGTINEVVNGFFEDGEPIETRAKLGVLPMGTGGDFRRTFDIPLDAAGAGAVLSAGASRRIDAGRVTFATGEGSRGVRHFVNIADAGIGGDVVNRVNRGPKLVNGEVTFMLASIVTLLRWRNKPMSVSVDGEEHHLIAQQVVVANGRYFGGGMKVAPHALPDDGLFDVVIAGDLSTIENVRGLSKIREGTHLDEGNPKITYARGRRVEVSSPEKVRLDVDGEQPGVLPATFEVMPGVIDLVCPPFKGGPPPDPL